MFSTKLEQISFMSKPKGRKSSALYQNPRSTHFSCFLDILWKMFFYQNDIVCMQIQKFTIVSNPKGDKKTPSIRIRVRHICCVFSTCYEKRFTTFPSLSIDFSFTFQYCSFTFHWLFLHFSPLFLHFSQLFLDFSATFQNFQKFSNVQKSQKLTFPDSWPSQWLPERTKN